MKSHEKMRRLAPMNHWRVKGKVDFVSVSGMPERQTITVGQYCPVTKEFYDASIDPAKEGIQTCCAIYPVWRMPYVKIGRHELWFQTGIKVE